MSFQVVVISLQTMNEAMENGSQVTYQDEDVLDPRPKAIPILARNGLDFNPPQLVVYGETGLRRSILDG